MVGITRGKVKYRGLITRKKNGARDNRSKIQGINRKKKKEMGLGIAKTKLHENNKKKKRKWD